ncbi:hypothetical protein Tco_1406824, partial [Tanacetum coccineum]
MNRPRFDSCKGQGHAEYAGLDDVVGDNQQKDVDFFRPNSSSSLLDYSYAAVWDMSFQVVATMFDKLGVGVDERWLKATSLVILRSDERAERRNEERKDDEIKKLRQKLTCKAKPMPSFYRTQGASKTTSEKIQMGESRKEKASEVETFKKIRKITKVGVEIKVCRNEKEVQADIFAVEGSGKHHEDKPGSGRSQCADKATSVTDERLQDVTRKVIKIKSNSYTHPAVKSSSKKTTASTSSSKSKIHSVSESIRIGPMPCNASHVLYDLVDALEPLALKQQRGMVEIVSTSAPTTSGDLIIIDDLICTT